MYSRSYRPIIVPIVVDYDGRSRRDLLHRWSQLPLSSNVHLHQGVYSYPNNRLTFDQSPVRWKNLPELWLSSPEKEKPTVRPFESQGDLLTPLSAGGCVTVGAAAPLVLAVAP